MGIENSTTRGPLSVFVLEQTLSLAPHIPTNVRSEFMREVFNKVESNYKPWGRAHFGSNEMRGYLLGLMGEAAIASGALSYKEDPARKVFCALDYWRPLAGKPTGTCGSFQKITCAIFL